jgi:energy-coupling factor transporter transmembrane protein EcfT
MNNYFSDAKYFTLQCHLVYYRLMTERGREINNLSGKIIFFLSSIALLTVLSGYAEPPQSDEGTAAHIFQLSIVALVPIILLFLATADWRQPLRSVRPLAIPAVALVLAFAALYYLEHYRNPNYGPQVQIRFSGSRANPRGSARSSNA